MYENYNKEIYDNTKEIIKNQNEIIEQQEEIIGNQNIKINSLNMISILITILIMLKATDMIHHIVDAGWKKEY